MEWGPFQFSPARTCLSHSPVSARGVQQVISWCFWWRAWLGGKSEHNIPISADEVCGQKNYTTLLKCPSIIDERFCLEGVESTSCPVSLTGSWKRNRDLRVVPAICKSFLEMFTQIWSLSGPAVIHKLVCSYYSERQTFSFIPRVQPTIEIGSWQKSTLSPQ